MSYNKTTWTHKKTVISADNMNKIENGIEAAHEKATNNELMLNEIKADAPQELDTFKELANAIGNDPNFSNTLNESIKGLKEEILAGLDQVIEALK